MRVKADLLAKTGSEHPSTGPEPACGISTGFAKKAVRDWANRNHKNIGNPERQRELWYTRALCQKNEGSVEVKQTPIKMSGRTIYRTLSPFQTGIDTSGRCLEEDESVTHIPCDCEAIAYLRFCHLGQFFMEPSDFYDASINKVLHFIRSVGLIKVKSKAEA
jgi:hypothetical protein